MYIFKEGFFKESVPFSTIGENTYAIKNEMLGYPSLTFGIAQNIVVNGRNFSNNPINAICVPYVHSLAMTPIEKIGIYLLNDIYDSTIINSIMSKRLDLDYNKETEHTIAYNGNTGEFYLV